MTRSIRSRWVSFHVKVKFCCISCPQNIEKHVHIFMGKKAFYDSSGVIKQRSRPCMTLGIVTEYICRNIYRFVQPSNVSDFSLVEYLWNMSDGQVRSAEYPPCNLKQLKDWLWTIRHQHQMKIYRSCKFHVWSLNICLREHHIKQGVIRYPPHM